MKRLLTTTALIAMTALPLNAQIQLETSENTHKPIRVSDQTIRLSTLVGTAVNTPAKGASQDIENIDIDDMPNRWIEIGIIRDVLINISAQEFTIVLSPNDGSESLMTLNMDSVTLKKTSNGEQFFVLHSGIGSDLDSIRRTDQSIAIGPDSKPGSIAPQVGLGELSGSPVYILNNETLVDEMPIQLPDIRNNWERIGNVADVILTREGVIKSVTIHLGGLLGLNETIVQANIETLNFLNSSEEDGTWSVVYTGDRDVLEMQKENGTAASKMNTETQSWVEETVTDSNAAERNEMADASNDRKDKLLLTAKQLDGAPVFDSTGENIGIVSRLLMSDNGTVAQAIIDVGGFLGVGEKPVWIAFKDLQIERRADTAFRDVRVSVPYTREELENMQPKEQVRVK